MRVTLTASIYHAATAAKWRTHYQLICIHIQLGYFEYLIREWDEHDVCLRIILVPTTCTRALTYINARCGFRAKYRQPPIEQTEVTFTYQYPALTPQRHKSHPTNCHQPTAWRTRMPRTITWHVFKVATYAGKSCAFIFRQTHIDGHRPAHRHALTLSR